MVEGGAGFTGGVTTAGLQVYCNHAILLRIGLGGHCCKIWGIIGGQIPTPKKGVTATARLKCSRRPQTFFSSEYNAFCRKLICQKDVECVQFLFFSCPEQRSLLLCRLHHLNPTASKPSRSLLDLVCQVFSNREFPRLSRRRATCYLPFTQHPVRPNAKTRNKSRSRETPDHENRSTLSNIAARRQITRNKGE